MIDDRYIIDNFVENNKIKIKFTKKFLDNNIEIKIYLENRYPDDEFISYRYVINRIINKIDILPSCRFCGKKLKNYTSKWCNSKCQFSDPEFIKNRNNKLKNSDYGKKISKTKQSWSNEKRQEIAKRAVETKKQKYGNGNNFQKIKETCLNKYGVENVFQNKDIKEKSKLTKIKKYNDPYFTNQEKTKNTIKEKYNIDNWMSSDVFRNKSSQTKIKKYNNPNFVNSEKSKQTCIEKYGVSNFGKTKEGINASHTPEVNERRINTMKKNGTLNTSKEELYIFEKLSEKFEVLQHYKDKSRYPFICDFYIPSLDLFIEYQGSMFHNKRPYLGIEDDLKEIEEIKQKSEKRKQITGKQKTRYDSLIETWTIRDVKKREIAKHNNLNYLEFFNIEEFNTWLNNYEWKNV